MICCGVYEYVSPHASCNQLIWSHYMKCKKKVTISLYLFLKNIATHVYISTVKMQYFPFTNAILVRTLR
jgi:hypothetical protein